MKTITGENRSHPNVDWPLTRALTVAGFLFALLPAVLGVSMDPGGGGTNSAPTYTPLDSWSFQDNTNWTSDKSYAPVSFTNLGFSFLGNGSSLVVNSTNTACLQYNVYETDGTTNLTVDQGTVMFWFASSWSSTNQGGTGPGEWGRLLETGAYTPDSSYGWWSIYVDDVGENIYFSAQTNDLSSNVCNYVSAPIAWRTNYFHCVALTYSATNTALYLDGALATNGPPMTNYPGPDVLANGFNIGSDSNGVFQAKGLFNNVVTYAVPLDADTIQTLFSQTYLVFMMYPQNTAMFRLFSADFTPSTSSTPNVITGQGNLMLTNLAEDYIYGTNAYQVWITNTTASVATDGNMKVTFTIEGGLPGYYYDVFIGTSLTSPLGNAYWTWQGQGQRRQQCSLSNLPQGTVFIILGTPLDSDGDGLTDAYELLVSKTDPHNPDTDGDGIPDGWSVLLGFGNLSNVGTDPAQRANYGYTSAGWLNQISGIRSGTVGLDNEGNVTQASQ